MRQRKIENYLPLAYFVAALALVFVLLPSVLRQAPPEQNQSAEFSPDAPPDDEQQSIISSLNRAVTGTAGQGQGEGVNEEIGEAVGPAPGIGKGAPRSCGRGFGNPPRQAESLYAPPCAPAFSGDNGGATSKGVDRGEVRIGVSGVVGAQPTEGPMDAPNGDQNAQTRTLAALQVYFNQNFQFYGRQLRMIAYNGGGDNGAGPAASDDEKARAKAAKLDDQYKVFGVAADGSCGEFARRKLIAFCPQLPDGHFTANRPYNWAWYMSGTKLARFTSEYFCKKLAGKNATFAGDGALQGQRRTLGVVYAAAPPYDVNGVEFQQFIKEECGVDTVVAVGYELNADNASQLATAATRLKLEGVTTVALFTDYASNAALMRAATQQSYFPEWLTMGFGAIDRNFGARVQGAEQWSHAFGITSLDAERRNEVTDCFKIVRSIDPAGNPNNSICVYVYPSLLQLVSGIQAAGPNLTPETFEAGLFKVGRRFYKSPNWAIGGGFGPGDYTYTDNVAEIWYDPDAIDPTDQRTPGAWRYVRDGKRYKLGELPREDPLVFRDGQPSTSDADSADGELE